MPALPQRRLMFGRLAMLACALLWSTSGLFIKLVDSDPFLISGARSLLAALTMAAFRCIFTKRPFAGLDVALKTPAFWVAAASYSITMITFVVANKLTASANVILLQYSAPVWAALLGIVLLKERPRRQSYIALALVLAGLFIIFRDSLASTSLAGDIIALVSGLTFALNSVCMRMQKDATPAYSLLAAHLLTALAALPVLFTGGLAISSGAAGSLIFMGTVQIGLASLLFAYGIKRVSAFAALLIACIEPVLNPVWVFAVTGERPAPSAILGGLVIIFAVAFSTQAGPAAGKPDAY